MKVEPMNWAEAESLPQLYMANFHAVANRFEFNPWEQDALTQRAADLDGRTALAADRDKLADRLLQYNKAMGNSQLALNHIAKLRNEKTLTVVGGQQAGLLTGPMLVIYKAMTIIQEARRAQEMLGRDVVPVFWVAGEDHDYQEVNHTYYLSSNLTCDKIELPHPGEEDRTPVSNIHFDKDAWHAVLTTLDDALIPTEFKAQIMTQLQACAEQSDTLSDFFARMMAWLFAAHGLVLVDAHDPEIRQLESPMFATLLQNHEQLSNAFLQGKAQVEALGFAPQATVQENGVNVFKILDGQRLLLQYEDGYFTDKVHQHKWQLNELVAIAENSPQLLSNNVLTRPLMQEFLFPVLATVLGPGEISYWALLKEGFRVAGMRMPIIIPRIQIALVEGSLQKHMQKYDMTLADVYERFDAKKQAWLSAQDELNLDERFEEAKQEFERLYSPLLAAVSEVNPGLKKLGDTNMSKIVEQITFLQKRTASAFEKQFDASLRQMDRIQLSLLPMGKPQERVYNIFSYINKYGQDWIDELVNTPLSTQQGKFAVYF